jgi:hypothetical protein
MMGGARVFAAVSAGLFGTVLGVLMSLVIFHLLFWESDPCGAGTCGNDGTAVRFAVVGALIGFVALGAAVARRISANPYMAKLADPANGSR